MPRVLRHRDFRLLWLGQTASVIGDRMIVVAIALYLTETGSPTDVGVVLAANMTRSCCCCWSAACGRTACRAIS